MMRPMATLLAAALVLLAQEEATWTATITVEQMHCEACREALSDNLKALPDAKVSVDGTTAVITLPEKAVARYKALTSALPSDLKLKSITVTLRGIITARGDALTLKAKESKAVFALANADKKKKDVLGELGKALNVPPKYVVTGELVEKDRTDTILLSAVPAVTQWKDEK